MNRFSASQLQQLKEVRNRIRPPFEIPDCTHGWQEYLISTGDLFGKLDALRIKDGFQLRCFVTAMAGNASSRLYAVPYQLGEKPSGISQESAPTAQQILSEEGPGKPEQIWILAAGVTEEDAFREPVLEGAMDHFMLAVEGDDSPLSYLLGSFVTRDGEEFAASWHGVHWGAQTLLLETPFWSLERVEEVAWDVVETYEEFRGVNNLSFLLERYEQPPEGGYKPFQPGARTSERAVRRCTTNAQLLKELILDYQLGEDHSRVDGFKQINGREPNKEEEESLQVVLPKEWEAALNLPSTEKGLWTWLPDEPQVWGPTFKSNQNEMMIQFLTYTELGQERIVRHTDRYQRGQYLPQRDSVVVGTGKGGYIH